MPTGSNTDNSESLDVCSLQKVMDCSREAMNISCTSIDLLANKSDCRMCVSGIWMSLNNCIVEIDDRSIQINISNTNGIRAQINENMAFECHVLNASCVPSNYRFKKFFNGTSDLTEAEQNNYLFCENNAEGKDLNFNNELYYCLKKDNEAVCYDREGDCPVEIQDNKLTCNIKKYSSSDDSISIIDKKDCQKIKELSNCTFKVSVNSIDSSENFNTNVTINCNSMTPPCSVSTSVDNLCKLGSTLCKDTSTTNLPTTTPTPVTGSDKGPSYTWLLIIIIVILLLLLVSYYGYQNQWHHKVSTLYLMHLVT